MAYDSDGAYDAGGQHSPDATGGRERKRRRKVLSCYDCRRRKLQCDRALPACGRCIKAGQADSCLYVDDPRESPVHDSTTTDNTVPNSGSSSRVVATTSSTGSVIGRLEYQEKKIRELEGALSQQNSTAVQRLKNSKFPLTPESMHGGDHLANVQDRENILFRGRSFKTEFKGTSHLATPVAYMPDMNLFMKEVFAKFPALSRIRQNMKQVESRAAYSGPKHEIVTDDQIRALLPPKDEAQRLIDIYLDNFDTIYHVIHVPTFRQQCASLWRNPQSVRAHFVAVLLLVISVARCLESQVSWYYAARSSTSREKAVLAIQACEDWILSQSQKHVTVEDFQIRFLLVFSKLVNARKLKRGWTEAGNCLRFFMCAGLHRTPDMLRQETTALDKEMRRRLWAAASEFELQLSFDRGMMSIPWAMQSDCPPPSNIHDEDLDQSSMRVPSAKAATEFTKSSYLNVAGDSVLLRVHLNIVVNSIRQTVSFDEAKRLTEEVETQIDAIPEWIGTSSNNPRALLVINLRQYLLALHDRQTRHATSPTGRNFSRTVILDTATKIIDAHRAMVSAGSYLSVLLCQDILRSALTVCHVYVTLDPKADSVLYRFADLTAVHVLNEANDLLTEKVNRYGREQRQQWMALAALGYTNSKRDPERRLAHMQDVVDRLTRPYYKILAAQEERPVDRAENVVVEATGKSTQAPIGVLEYLPYVEGEPNLNDPQLLDLDAIAAWTFEDLLFNADDFANVANSYAN